MMLIYGWLIWTILYGEALGWKWKVVQLCKIGWDLLMEEVYQLVKLV